MVEVVLVCVPALLGSPYCVHLAVITMFYWPSSNNEASSIEWDACNGQSMMAGRNVEVWATIRIGVQVAIWAID